MTNVHKALEAFWNGFDWRGTPMRAYLSGRVPTGAAFPYITYEAAAGAFGGSAILTAFVWVHKGNGVDADEEREDILDQIAAAIPEGGRMLRYPGGGCILYRNHAGFMSYYDDPADKDVLGGRVSYQVNYYGT